MTDAFRPSRMFLALTFQMQFGYMLALLTGALFLSGCYVSASGSGKQALALASAFHAQMARGDLAGIYNDADSGYRKAASRAQSDAIFSAIARKLGSPENCKQGNTTWKVSTWGTTIQTVCQTDFSKHAQGVETFVWIKSGDQYRLLGYHINSEALIER